MLLNNIICTTLCLSVAATGDRWSRQITNTGQHADGGADWIPVSQQVDRSNNARVLSYQPDQYNKNEYSVPLIDPELQRRFPAGQPFQAQGFKPQSKPQSKAFHHNRDTGPPQQPPTSQSFFKFEMPFYQNDGSRREVIPTVQADYQIQHTLPQQSFLTSPLFSQKPVFPPEYHPNYQPSYQPFNQQRPIHQNFVQDIQQQMKEKHIQQKPQPASSSFGTQNIFEPPKPTTFDAQPPYDVRQQVPASTGQQEVQLLYVPYDTLYPQRTEQLTYDNNRFNLIPQPVNPAQINNFYTPEPLINQDPNLFTTSTTSTVPPSTSMPMTTARAFLNPQFTSQKPKIRPKPHQPPLAMFMQKSPEKPSTAIDVVNALSSAKSIAVLDAPTKLAPEVFVGPSGLPSPSGYTKFELPYLSSINRNNIEYLREIPFFVAPQSYRAPIDFNKIVLPEPHVGSIVINKPLQSSYEGAIMQDHQQPTQQPQEHVRDMYNVAFTEEPVKYHQSSTPTLRTTIRPSKNRFQFGTAYEASLTPHQSLRGQYKQDTRSGSSTASVQTQTKDVSNQNEYFQQQFIQEIQPPTTVRSQVNNAEKQPGLNEYYKGQYSHIPQQVSPMKTIVGTREQLSADNFKEQFRQDVTSYRPSIDQHFNQQFTTSTSDVPPKLNPQIGEYLNEQYNQEVHPVTSIRPTTSRGRPEQIEYLKEQYIQEGHPVTSLRPTTVRQQTERNEYFKERYNQKLHREKPALIHSQQSQNDYYSQRGEISLTSTKPTRTKDSPKQHKFKIQNNQEELADISNASGYAKDQLEQIQYIGGTYRQEYRPSTTSRAPSTRSKNSDRVRNNQHRRPVEISTQSSYGQFKPMPNNVVNEEYFKVQPIKTTDSTTTTEPTIQQYSTEGVDQPTYINGFSTSSTVEIKPSHDQNQHRYNIQPSLYMNKDEEEYRMKTYFRQQHAFKNRPTVQSTTTPAGEIYENVQYTPISLDYGSQLYNLPSSTATYLDESTLREPKLKEKITFYAPTPQQSEEQQPVLQETPISNQPIEYSHETEHQPPQTEPITESSSQEPTTSSDIHHTSTEKKRPSFKYSIPNNHRPTYNNEVAYSHEDKDEKSSQEQELEYEPNPYQLPSELPPLTPNLPGLVNALIEQDKENAIEKGTTEMDRITTTTSTLRPTRRPINRGKRPPVTRISSSISYSSGSETTTRRPSSRGRRPYNPRNNYNQTTHTTTARSPIIRNPNRVRYNPTPEERRQYRPRTRLHSKKVNGEEDNLDYQRDVLNQNYPVFKPASRSTTDTDTTTTEQTPTEAQEIIVTITPNNSKQQFVGLLEPLKIAQEYHQIPRQDNFGPGYFPNEEDEVVPTEIILEKNEINENHPIFTTTTTVAPIETTKKSLFIRRGSRPSRTTTENPPTTTFVNDERQTEKSTEKSTEKFTVRPRIRPERPERPKVFKIRGRIRKPHPASTTTTFAPEKKLPESGYHQLHKFNQDFYQDEYRDEIAQSSPNRLHNYNLETQESQWSPSLSNVNAFKPVNPEERSNLLRKSEKFENEPDIVTASPDFIEEKKDSFSFNVSAGIGQSSYSSLVKSDSKTDNKNTSQTSFSELLEEVMSGVENMYKNKNADTQLDNTRKTNNQQGRRKGAWKRVRVSPSDTLEASESQNIGTQIYNSIFGTTSVGQEYGTKIQMEEKSSNEEPTPLDNLVESITDEPISSPTTTFETKTSEFETDLSVTAPSIIQEGATATTNPAKSKSKTSLIELEDSFTTLPLNIDKGPDDVTDIPEYLRDNVETITDSITRRSDIEEPDDLETQPSLFDEVKKQLSNLFAVEENNEDDDGVKQIFQPRKQEYTSIQRIRAVSENTENKLKDTEQKSESVTVSPFHKNLMDTVVYATSTSTEVSHETEICYRGRCVKAAKQL